MTGSSPPSRTRLLAQAPKPRGGNKRSGSDAENHFAISLRQQRITDWVREYEFMPDRKFRFDFAWPLQKVAVEIQGGGWIKGRHTRGGGIESDCQKACLAVVHGWRLLVVTPSMVRSGQATMFVKTILNNA